MDHLRLKRRSTKYPSVLKIITRMNEIDDFLRQRFEESLMGGVGEIERVMLRDALLEGYILGIAWTLGDSDMLEDILHDKDDIGLGMSQAHKVYGRS